MRAFPVKRFPRGSAPSSHERHGGKAWGGAGAVKGRSRRSPCGCRRLPTQSNSRVRQSPRPGQCQSELQPAPRHSPASHYLMRRRRRETSHPVAAHRGWHQNPSCSRRSSPHPDSTNLYHGVSQPGRYTVRPSGIRRGLSSRGMLWRCVGYADFRAAPSGTSPCVT